MDNTSYIALSRQITLQRELDISANNLANMNTTGYKFEELLINAEPGAIVLDPKKGEPTISADGIISQMSQGQAERVGRLNVVRIANMSDLSKNGDSTFSLTSNAAALPATNASVSQGFLEASNVNPMSEVTNLVRINRAYASVASIIEQNSQLNRTAVERLGRVA